MWIARLIAGFSVVASLGPLAAAGENVLVNPDFATNDLTGWETSTRAAAASWSARDGAVRWDNPSRFVDTSSICQYLPLTPTDDVTVASVRVVDMLPCVPPVFRLDFSDGTKLSINILEAGTVDASALLPPGKEIISIGVYNRDACSDPSNFLVLDDFTLSVGAVETPVEVDIRPGTCPNALNRRSRGVLPVAVLGDESLALLSVGCRSVSLSRADGVGASVEALKGPPGPRFLVLDVDSRSEHGPCECDTLLVGDGLPDLLVRFDIRELTAALELDRLSRRSVVELVIQLELMDGSLLRGTDCVLIVR